MLRIIAFATAVLLLGSAPGFAQQWVNGYTRSNGTVVQGYYRSTPDGDPSNNYSTQGNVNPYTGAVGTREPSWNGGSLGGSTYGQPLGGAQDPLGSSATRRANCLFNCGD